MKRWILLPLLAVLLVTSCKSISSFLHDGEVVAKVGKHKLFATELEEYIPGGIAPEDSIRLALQYIDKWAMDMLFMDMAESELTKAEKDVTKEIESYRRSLLKYRYEQQYVNQRLDTAVAQTQIEKYYNDHLDRYVLVRPIVKARFARISEDSPNLSAVRKNMTAEQDTGGEDMLVSDSLTTASSLLYTDFGKQWVDIVELAREFEVDYLTLQAALKNGVAEIKDGKGNVCIAHVSDMKKAGETGPVEYYADEIRENILSTRKQNLLSGLERELIEKARTQENYEIY
ncbi:MAG: hypothetical protein J6S66_05235 [Bacteroidales bacterium]|nr:hypothetical protein [Bacteroidales bacterium]